MKFDLVLGFAPQVDIQNFHADRERHREVNVPFGDFLVESFQHQSKADQNQKAERQHFQGRMFLDKGADASRENQHENHRDNDGNNHHGNVVSHADGGDHRVQ